MVYKKDNIWHSLWQRQNIFSWMHRDKEICSIIIYLMSHNVDRGVTKFWSIVIALYLHNIPETLLSFVASILCLSVEMYFRILSLMSRRWKIHSSNNVYHFRRKEIDSFTNLILQCQWRHYRNNTLQILESFNSSIYYFMRQSLFQVDFHASQRTNNKCQICHVSH